MPTSTRAPMPWEPYFRAMAESTPDWESWHDEAGQLRFVNHGVERLTGYSADECLAMADFPSPLITPGSRETWLAARQETAGDPDHAGRCDLEIRRKDGTVRWISASWQAVRDADGRCLGFRSSAHDIQERIQAERERTAHEAQLAEEVRAVDARYRLVTAHATDVIFTCDLDERLLWVSPSVERMLGYSPVELTGHPLDRILTPGARALASAVFTEGRRLVEANLPMPDFRFELENVRKDGSVVWVELNGRVIVGPDGRASGFIVMSRDIDARRRTEDALRASEERYRLLAQHVTDVIWATDLTGRLTYVSPSAERMLGCAAGDLMGSHALQTMTEDSSARILDCVRQALARARAGEGDVTFLVEGEHVRPDGVSVCTEVHGSVLCDADGRPSALLGVSRDISERRRAEALTLQASRMQATATLAGGIAHDFNNLMVAVLGYAELLKMEVGGRTEVNAMISEIVAAATRATELSQQMLAYARGGRYQTRDLDLNTLARQVLEAQQRTAPPGVRYGGELAPDLWKVNADPRQMTQTLNSLCTNAMEAIEGTGDVTVTTSNEAVEATERPSGGIVAPGRWVRLTVSDTGCGMTPAVRARVFEPFFSTKFTGRGLGLPAVLGIVENHGGRVAVTATEPGKGTTLTVWLPAV